MIQFLNKWTGEIHELPDETPEQVKNAWLGLSETIKACERARNKLKPKVEKILDDNGLYNFGDYQFRQMTIQRQNYDKAIMRRVLDDDTFDLFLIPDKTAIDEYIKENVAELGADAAELRSNMIAIGEPYNILRLEKLA